MDALNVNADEARASPSTRDCLPASAIERFAEDRPMRSPEDAAAAAHLASCARCAAARDEARGLRSFLADVAPILRGDDRAPGAGAALLAEGAFTERRVLHGYRLVEPIGHGGQGEVWRAVHQPSGRAAAVKVVRGATPQQRLRMQREAQLAAGLRHPGIVNVFDCGALPDSGFAIAMELVDGVPLDAWARRVDEQESDAGERVRRKVRLVVRVCAALHHAHQHGVIHRDLKPGNILVEQDDQPRIVDFGLARSAEAGSGWTITRSGEFAGTLAYAAPEQLAAASDGDRCIGTPADLYSLGVVLYEAIAGCPPYDATGPIEQTISRVLHIDPAPPRRDSTGAAIDPDLATIVLKTIAKAPERRYDSAAALRDDLERWLDGRPIDARRASAFYVFGKFLGRHRTATRSTVAALLAVTALGAALWFASREAKEVRASRAELFRNSENAVGKSLHAARLADDWLERAGEWVEEAQAGQRLAVADARRLGEALRASKLVEAKRLAADGDLEGSLWILWEEALAPSCPGPGVISTSGDELDDVLELLRALRADQGSGSDAVGVPQVAEVDRWIERLAANGVPLTNTHAICEWAASAPR